MHRRGILKRVAALGAASWMSGAGEVLARGGSRPNILFLLADDLRFDGVGYLNKQVRTPHLDRLAQQGVRFLNAFVTTSICCTSRASIFTGTYARRHGVWDFETPLPRRLLKKSYPAVLRQAGYRTGFFGKYGVGDVGVKNGVTFDGVLPEAARDGFDVIEDDGFAYYRPDDVKKAHHSNQRLAEQAEQFIRSTPAGRPFCLSISFNAPHEDMAGELPAEADLLRLYAKDVFTAGPLASEAAFQTLPPFIRNSVARQEWQRSLFDQAHWQSYVRRYYALVSGIDRAVGRILAALEATGHSRDTAIIFTSDNGHFLGDYGLSGKWFGYEASIRIPLLIKPVGQPAVQDVQATALNIDFAPTMLALAGLPIPPLMQGRDLSPLWMGTSSPSPWQTDFLYEHALRRLPDKTDPVEMERYIPTTEGVRDERYTYLRYPHQVGEREQLFDRMADLDELKNIIHRAPYELVERLRRRTDELIAQNA